MATVNLLEKEQSTDKVKKVFDDISETRGDNKVNNIWKALANDPDLLEATWNRLKKVMAPGALDPVTKELIYIAVSIINGCEYCIHSHTAMARKKGMTEEMRSELLAVIAMASQTNALANAYQIEVDADFKK